MIDESLLADAREIDAFIAGEGESLPSLENTLRLVRDVDTDRLREVGKDVWGTGGSDGGNLVGSSFDECIIDLNKAMNQAASWTGDANNAYTNRVDRTKGAINEMRDPAVDVGNALVNIADAWDENFGHSVADILTIVGFVIAAIGVVVAAVTSFTGVGAIVGLVVAIIGLLISAASIAWGIYETERTKVDALESAGQAARETMTSAEGREP
ncbi:hypothetical protein [Haloechinothrix sp. LS1_15]|uniref:hypothetical protein n=1 Tax=Haloechinothrix sp. LS1_15 TaxID=2652248 RepID=UPI00294B7965|nr:hypothetical protein [Haloechinothrix sp. LS1_15]